MIKKVILNFTTAVNADALIPLKDFNLLLQETYVYGSVFEISRKSKSHRWRNWKH